MDRVASTLLAAVCAESNKVSDLDSLPCTSHMTSSSSLSVGVHEVARELSIPFACLQGFWSKATELKEVWCLPLVTQMKLALFSASVGTVLTLFFPLRQVSNVTQNVLISNLLGCAPTLWLLLT